jgi:hypothetical protein
MAEMWRWAAGLQAAAELLHRRSALAWHAPTAPPRRAEFFLARFVEACDGVPFVVRFYELLGIGLRVVLRDRLGQCLVGLKRE